MRRRFAVLAILACLVCFALLLTASTSLMRYNMTERLVDDMLGVGRLSAVYLGNAALFDTEEARDGGLAAITLNTGYGVSLIDSEGKVLYDSRPSINVGSIALRDPEVAEAMETGEGTGERMMNREKSTVVAVRMENGQVLRLFAPSVHLRDVYDNHMRILPILSLLFVLICLCCLVVALRRSWTTMRGVSRMLTDLAEGNFESRLTLRGESNPFVETINESAARIQDQFKRQNRRNLALAQVISSIQSGLIAVDANMRVLLLTPAGKALLDVKGAFEGLNLSEVSKHVNLEPAFREAMGKDGVFITEVAMRSGGLRAHKPLRLYISAMKDGEKVMGAMALLEDVSELRRLEQMRTDFAANVSHELKTPLTSIKGFVETLQAGAIENPAMANKFLNIINMETDRLTRLINDILSITRMESGKEEVSSSRLSLCKMVGDVCDMLQIHARDKKVTLTNHHNEEKIYIWGNKDRVEQMLINLIENAIKYNKEGGSVTVSVFGGKENIQLLVADTGIGIPEEHLPRLFERFYRVDKGRSRAMGGTGLGLAIVKHIVTSMNGMIEVHSKFGEGTEFLITLPRYYGDGKTAQADVGNYGEKESEEE